MNLTIQPKFYSTNNKRASNKNKISFKGNPENTINELKQLLEAKNDIISALTETIKAHEKSIFHQKKTINIKDQLLKQMEQNTQKLESLFKKQLNDQNKSFEEYRKKLFQTLKMTDAKEELMEKFIKPTLIENTSKNSAKRIQSTVPHGIIINSDDTDIANNVAYFAMKHSESDIIPIDFETLNKKEVLNKLDSVDNGLKKLLKFDSFFAAKPNGSLQQIPNQRTIIYLTNFEKFTKPTEENKTIIEKLKNIFDFCIGDYKGTIIANINNNKGISPEIINDKYFPLKIDLDG